MPAHTRTGVEAQRAGSLIASLTWPPSHLPTNAGCQLHSWPCRHSGPVKLMTSVPSAGSWSGRLSRNRFSVDTLSCAGNSVDDGPRSASGIALPSAFTPAITQAVTTCWQARFGPFASQSGGAPSAGSGNLGSHSASSPDHVYFLLPSRGSSYATVDAVDNAHLVISSMIARARGSWSCLRVSRSSENSVSPGASLIG